MNKQKTLQIFPGPGGEEGMNKEQRSPENTKVHVNLARQRHGLVVLFLGCMEVVKWYSTRFFLLTS